MDNKTSHIVKQYLVLKDCDLILVEPNNHHVNAAKQAIQTFKNYFIGTLAMTDSKFPLQLWDHLAPQVKNTLNMLCPSCIYPKNLAYKAIQGPYNWNRFPLALLGCKAVNYKSPETCISWGSHGTNAWYVGPSLDHYC